MLADALEARLLDIESVERRLEAAGRALALVLSPGGDRDAWVRWIDGRGQPSGRPRNILFAAAPVEPGPILRESLFDKLEATIATSATLSTGGGFQFVRGRLGLASPAGSPEWAGRSESEPVQSHAGRLALGDVGLPFTEGSVIDRVSLRESLEVTEHLLPSPFDYRTQALFGVPTDLPAHDSGLPFQVGTARVIAEFAEITDGGLFVLFTSHRALRTVAGLAREAGTGRRWPILVHGEAPRTHLLKQFVESGNGILLGTASFWEGVDVPGRPLRGLVLQKIPFRVPTEPITQARMEVIEARGMRAFDAYQVPHAALRLKQGFGRLIRSREDRGGVLLLDSRILTRRYGRVLRSALPPAPLVKGPWNEVRMRLEAFYREWG
jgi:ATP-dependent DNA helicase DinG